MVHWVLMAAVFSCGQPKPDNAQDMVHIRDGNLDYWIDQYEYPNQPGTNPTANLDLSTAQEACASAGKRLCTAAEWRRACQGDGGGLRYGYGMAYEPERCHSGIPLPSGHTSMMDPDALVASSGSYADCVTEDGLYDMTGNLEEWVLDDWRGVGAMLEGGAWYTHMRYADCTGWYSREPDYRLDPSRRVLSAGTRCCWSAEQPTSEDIGLDSRRRLEMAARMDSEADYAVDNEVLIAESTYIDRFEYPNLSGEFPRVVVSWEEASALCAAADKRLCSAYEWERACGGLQGWSYPYGQRYQPSSCGVDADGPVRSNHHLACTSTIGAQDMVGGVWEWTATHLDVFTLTSSNDEVLRELRGGSWYVDEEKGQCSPVQGYPAATQTGQFPDVGFRCCRGPELSSATNSERAQHACPDSMVPVGSFCIDAYEHPGTVGVVPEANIDFPEAQNACAARSLRVCTTEEWEQACRGSQGRRWPYGDTYVAGTCNDKSDDKEQSGEQAEPSGARSDCVTPEGVFDLSGNLWEWTQSSAGQGQLRGGGWNISSGLGMCRSGATADNAYKSIEVGVRCCISEIDVSN